MINSKKIPQFLKLKDNHPTMVKLMKLYDLAEELQLTLSFESGTCSVMDGETGLEVMLEDIEPNHMVFGFPHGTEFKLIYENPKYREQQDAEYAERRKKEAAAEKAAKDKLAEKIREAEAAVARRHEEVERKKLAELKAKYET